MSRSKSRRIADDDEVEEQPVRRINECSTLDHIYPGNPPTADTKCYCGKKTFKPFIVMDEYLKAGEIVRTYPGGPMYEVEMVTQSRARCRVITSAQVMRRAEDAKPVFLPIPGSVQFRNEEVVTEVLDDEEEERRGRIINISPRSVVIRVSAADVERETYKRSDGTMAMKNVAQLPVAGKSAKEREQDRRAKLATKPNGAARPLSGAAAKAKASARAKTPKTVRECGCGCGGETMAHFVPGHDARYKGWMKKLASGELDQAGLQKLMGKKVYGRYTFKKSGAGFVPKESYQEAAGG